jgi:hypothetical protein
MALSCLVAQRVKFPPHARMQLLSLAKAGDRVQAEGFGTSNSYGQVLQATGLTVNRQSVSFDPLNQNLPPVKSLN